MKTWLMALTMSALATAACGAAGDRAGGGVVENHGDHGADAARLTPATGTAPTPTNAGAAPARPSPTDGYDWHLRINEEERTRPAILAYEVDGTDDQPLNFTCEEGGARIFAGISGGPVDLAALTLVSGDQTLRLRGTTEQTEIAEMPSFTSEEIDGNAPFIKAFAANGWLKMTAGGRTTDMAGDRQGAKAIADFVAHCSRR